MQQLWRYLLVCFIFILCGRGREWVGRREGERKGGRI